MGGIGKYFSQEVTFKLMTEGTGLRTQEKVCVLGEGQHYSQGDKRNKNNDNSDDNDRKSNIEQLCASHHTKYLTTIYSLIFTSNF